MTQARVAAQAKINLRLKLLARETTGYHSIDTVFHRIDLADDVTVRLVGSGRTIDCRGADTGPAEKNLAYRAAVAYAEASGWPAGFAIEIDKRIPVGGGMGGGSADAGAVLRALEALAPASIGGPRLRDLAATLGADVPFLTTADPMALAWGRGERMIALPAPPSRQVIVLIPSFGIATGDAYGWWDQDNAQPAVQAWRKTVAQFGDWEAIDRMAENDFEAPVFARHPVLDGLVQRLQAGGASLAMMSGSGSAVFGVYPGALPMNEVLPGEVRIIRTQTSATVEPVAID